MLSCYTIPVFTAHAQACSCMIEFFPPILEHFCPLFVQIAQMGLILPKWGLILPTITPPTPVQRSHTPFWEIYLHKNTSSPPQNAPFPWPELECGQNELLPGQFGPQLSKIFEKWAKLF